MNHLKTIDTSGELVIQKYKNGIKLTRPEKVFHREHFYSVDEALQFPYPILIYFYNTEHAFQCVSETLAMTNGFDSPNNAIGKTMFAIATKKCAKNLIANNQEVLKYKRTLILDENLDRLDGLGFCSVSIKTPWYDDSNILIGIFGCSLVLDTFPLAEAFTRIAKLGILPHQSFSFAQAYPVSKINDVYLSHRETECLKWYIRGKSAREVAEILQLSHRTVENYLANVKEKLCVKSKSELIDSIIDYFK